MLRFLHKSEWLQRKTEELLTFISAVIVGIMMVITVSEVILRRFFGNHVPGSYEYVQLLFVFVIFFGIAYAQEKGTHITIGVLYDRVSRKTRVIFEILTLTIALVIFASLTWYSWQSAWFNYQNHDTLLGSIQVITAPSRFAIPVGTGMISLRLIVQLSRLLRKGQLVEEHIQQMKKESIWTR